MATTQYTILKGATLDELAEVGTKSKRDAAIKLAEEIRKSEKLSVRVVTGAGTVVLELKARKPQKKTKPYTRVVELPEGFEVPANERVAYTRSRKGCAITHEFAEDGGTYRVRDLKSGEVLAHFDTTRQCGRFLADSVTLDDEGKVLVSA